MSSKKPRTLREIPTGANVSPGVMALNPHLYGPQKPVAAPVTAPSAPPARDSTLKATREPNKTEAAFIALLEARQRRGEIRAVRYEGIRLKWGACKEGAMHYTPDAVVTELDGSFTMIEIKGAHVFDRDIVRFKGCRAAWAEFTFQMWQWKNREWTQIL